MPPLRRDFGRHLRSIRDERGLTQEAFSELLGISVDFLSLVERGINAPSFETIESIAHKLDLPVSALFAFKENASGRYEKPEESQT